MIGSEFMKTDKGLDFAVWLYANSIISYNEFTCEFELRDLVLELEIPKHYRLIESEFRQFIRSKNNIEKGGWVKF